MTFVIYAAFAEYSINEACVDCFINETVFSVGYSMSRKGVEVLTSVLQLRICSIFDLSVPPENNRKLAISTEAKANWGTEQSWTTFSSNHLKSGTF